MTAVHGTVETTLALTKQFGLLGSLSHYDRLKVIKILNS
jgi:hypothetical protein